MANELQYYGDPAYDTGLTITGKVYDSSGSQVGSDVSCTEVGSLAIYRGNMPTASAGEYAVRFFDASSVLKSQGIIYWDGSAEITIETLNDLSSSDIQSAVTTSLNSYDPPTKAELDAGFAALNDLSSTEVENAVWNATSSSHTTVGSMGWENILSGRIIDDTTLTGTPTSTSLQLTAGSSTDDFYNDQLIYIAGGLAAGLVRIVSDYDGATKTVTLDESLPVVPSSGDRVVMQADHVHALDQISSSVDAVLAPSFTSIESNLTTVDTGIQDNLEIINDGVKNASKLIPHNVDLS